MDRKILLLKSSPRRNGNSSILADRAAEGARDGGAVVTCINLAELKIQPCKGCDACKKAKGFCTIQDDMQSVYPKLIETDALIIASPIYWFTFSAQLKLCMDRWYGLFLKQRDFLRNKPVGIILAYGDDDLESSGGINAVHTFESAFRYLGASMVGVVHGSLSDPGDAIKNPELMQKAYELGKSMGE